MSVVRRGLAVLALVVLLPACAVVRGAGENGAGRAGQVTIEVENQNFNDATIFLLWGTERRRLGNVTGLSSQRFRTDWRGPELRVEVSLLAGGSYVGPAIAVSPGDVVDVTLPPNLDRMGARRR
jgi:hypothetical protein